MSELKRTVENGGTFSAPIVKSVRKQMAVIPGSVMVVCPACQVRAARVKDHTTPISWGGSNSHENLGLLCSRCHFEKSNVETKIDDLGNDLTVTTMQELHVAKWLHFQFDNTMQRRRPQLSKRAVDLNSAKRITRKECNIRRMRNPEGQHVEHVKKAKIHRQVRQRREFRKARA